MKAALRREPVDRVPIFMWYHPDTAKRLGRLLEIPPGRVAEAMGDDVRQAWVGNNYAMEGITHEREGQGHVDAWGIEWVKVAAFNQIRRFPLQQANRDEIFSYQYPYDHIDALMSNMEPVVSDGSADTFWIGCDVAPVQFEMVFRLRGMENALLDMIDDPELSERMLRQAASFAVRISEIACERFPLDWLFVGDDVGGQQGMIMSPSMWREIIRPHLVRVFDAGRSNGVWVAYHSCGSIRPIIPDLIEMGVQVLNPIQCHCPGMEALELKKEFGRDLVFMGGVDTQWLLPNGTADEVRRETARLIEGMTADGGGYILAASHTVPPETPDENIFAMYEAAGVSREEIFDRAADIRARVASQL
jgi:uroporphyrinogen decarboxylase